LRHPSAAVPRAAGGALSAEDLGRCQARTVPALEIPYRGISFQTAPGLTAGPTLGGVLRHLAERRFAEKPDAAYFEAVIEALQHAYAERLATMGDVEAGGPTSTTHTHAPRPPGGAAAETPHHGRRWSGRLRCLDHKLAVELWQPLCSARYRGSDE